MKRPSLYSIIFLLVYSEISSAEQNAAESFFLDDTPVILTATRLNQSLSDAPAAITVIDKAMIKASGAKEIVELFRLVPGMQVSYKKGHLPAVSYHGMNDQYARGMQVLVDGSSIYSASFGGLFWVDYPLLIEDIERIEVIRGPAAATHGPNAFLGVINIITTHTSQDQGVEANFRAGGGDYYRGSLRFGGKWKDLGYRFSFAHNQNDGLESTADSQKIEMFNSRFDYQLTSKDTLQYNFGYSIGKLEQGIENNLSDPARYEKSSGLTQNFRWEHQIDSSDQLSIHLTHKRHEKNNDFISNGKVLSNDQISERIDFELQHIFSPLNNVRIVWGLGTRFDRMRLALWTIDNDDKTNIIYRGFSNIEWKFLDDFSLNLGALVEKNSYTKVDLSPKIALNYLWSRQHSFRVMASRASRMPTLSEQNINVQNIVSSIINVRVRAKRTIKPVEVTTFEAGHHGQFFNNRLTTDFKVAHQRFRRLTQIIGVEFDAAGPILEYGNGDVARSLNYELQLDYRPDSKSLLHMGYSWINIKHKGGINNYRESAPNHTVNFLAAYEFPQRWQTSIAYYYRSSTQYLRSNELGRYQRLDLILRKTFKVNESHEVELSLIHQNNLGSKDEFEAGQRLADRTFLEFSYKFH